MSCDPHPGSYLDVPDVNKFISVPELQIISVRLSGGSSFTLLTEIMFLFILFYI